jgi:hypothetical protein
MQGLYFVYFYKTYSYIFLIFYIYIFFRFMRRLHVNGESWDFVLFDKTQASLNYITFVMIISWK